MDRLTHLLAEEPTRREPFHRPIDVQLAWQVRTADDRSALVRRTPSFSGKCPPWSRAYIRIAWPSWRRFEAPVRVLFDEAENLAAIRTLLAQS